MKFIAIAAMTIDGKIARDSHHMSNWTSKEDKVFMRGLLNKCDVIVVGNNTYKTAIKPLSKRNCIVLTRTLPPSPPFQGGVSRLPSGRGGWSKYVFQKSPNLLYCNPAKTDIKKLIKEKKYRNVAILGGAQTYTYCLQNNLLDELYLTIEPVVFGEGINLFSPPLVRGGAGEMLHYYNFKLFYIKKLNKQGSLLLHYKKTERPR